MAYTLATTKPTSVGTFSHPKMTHPPPPPPDPTLPSNLTTLGVGLIGIGIGGANCR